MLNPAAPFPNDFNTPFPKILIDSCSLDPSPKIAFAINLDFSL